MRKILLHICCANCAIYCIERLREMVYDVDGFFYNPNIHPIAEYSKRRNSVEEMSEKVDLTITYFKDYNFEDYFKKVSFYEDSSKCELCWKLRLSETAEYAAKRDYNAFSTTLLISPYQNQDIIKTIGNELSKKYSVQFIFEDFRKGFAQSQKEAKKMGLYRQNYCGCIYSESKQKGLRIKDL